MAALARKDASRAAATSARIAGLALPKGGFSAPARASALARLGEMGLPGKRDEYWRYTDPTDLVAAAAPEAALFTGTPDAELFGGIDRVVIAFADGVFDPARSSDLTLAG
ncbi:MAG: Fe-S cluster assembly protein SufD, partial [Albidovulum sp.]